ncbi:hypothetical protein AMECASPLE_023996 [Ameca splendens]|uniref:Uncharacterized protein n=1 Tax=Ameca splendens TaxID=208324 RepID=A0ABV0Y4K2_9TELE
MPISRGRNVDQPVNRELRLSTQLSLHYNGPAQHPYYCGGRTNSSVDLPLLSPLTHEQDPEIFELLQLRQKLPSNLKRASLFQWRTWPRTWRGRLPTALHLAVNCPSACCRSWIEGASRTTSSSNSNFWSPALLVQRLDGL